MLGVLDGGSGGLAPQVRQAPVPYQSRLLSFLRGHTDVLDRLVAEVEPDRSERRASARDALVA